MNSSTTSHSKPGVLIVNADDWGRDRATTQAIQDCTSRGSVSAVSAMVFMEDSAKAADVAKEQGIDAGLHLNLTAPFTSPACPADLKARHQKVINYLKANRLARIVFNPLLQGHFEHVVAAQIDEYRRLYGVDPVRIDGHHHMHLCANVLFAKLLPSGAAVRRNFSLASGEKSFANRAYRRFVDNRLARRHSSTDYFFSLPPLLPASRLQGIFSLAQQSSVEVETHPINPAEYAFLMGEDFPRLTGNLRPQPFSYHLPNAKVSA
jgi:chitin disaccharide deacetylase